MTLPFLDNETDPEQLARWTLNILRSAPAATHGAGRSLHPTDLQSLISVAAGEFLGPGSAGHTTLAKSLAAGLEPEAAESALRRALWHRLAQLVAQECENRDPEFKHARDRLHTFLRTSDTGDLVQFELFRVRYLTTPGGAQVRHLPVIPRDRLHARYAVPAEAGKYADGLGEWIMSILTDLSASAEYRPWLSVDDLAFLLARAAETANRQPWMSEPNTLAELSNEFDWRSAFARAGESTLNWFDERYAPGKNYSPELGARLRSAFLDHLQTLEHDPANHPGIQALLLMHFPEAARDFRNSSLRKDFEYIARHFRDDLHNLLHRLNSS